MTRTSPWWARDVYADRRPFLKARRRITAAIRGFFEAEGFEEVETAALQVSGGNETHLSAFATEFIGADGAPSACDPGTPDDCNAIGVCLQAEMEGVTIGGISAQ